MSEQARRFRLGMFVIAGTALLALGVFAISAGRLFQKTHPLYCYFEENVQGLEPGGPVKFRGVEVGRVDAVNVMPQGRIAAAGDGAQRSFTIEVRSNLVVEKISDETGGFVGPAQIDSAIRRQVDDGLRVRIAWKDITGQKYLDLDYVDPTKSPIPPLPFEPPGTYIPTAMEKKFIDIQRDVAAMTSELAQIDYKGLAQEIRALVTTLREKSEEIEGRKFGEAADAVRDLAKSPKIDAALVRVDKALAQIESAAARLDEFVARPSIGAAVDDAALAAASLKRVGAQLEDAIPKLTASVEETLAVARKTMEQSKLPETTEAARAVVADVGSTARQMGALREQARKLLSELGEASRGLSQLVKYVEENPNSLLHGKTEDPK
jgi:paraquat-inducible protein B